MHRLLSTLLLLSAPLGAQDNVLFILTDDLGVDIVGAYQEGPVTAPTPNIDALAQNGILFRNAWANPVCSPTRAHLQTGRYGFRTGLGVIVKPGGWAMSLDETTLPEALDAYAPTPTADAFFGKWHLGNETVGGPAAPNAAGWSHFAGTETNLYKPQNYFHWTHVENGLSTQTHDYATSRTVDDFLKWRETAQEPWVAVVAFHAPHDPFHAPPQHLHSYNLPNVNPRTRPRLFYRAMVEAMDTEIGRMLAGMGTQRARTNVLLMADNGTPREVCVSPFRPDHAKLTPYEGGVNVPLIVEGPIVNQPGREVAAMIHSTDMFCTVLDLAGVDQDVLHAREQLDGMSVVPYLTDPSQGSMRKYLFSEIFSPNGGYQSKEVRTVRGQNYKAIRRGTVEPYTWELYDLRFDPFELNDLVDPNMSPLHQAALRRLRVELDRILKS